MSTDWAKRKDEWMGGKRRQRLAQRRIQVGHSQEKLAEKVGVQRSTVFRWEAGDTDPQPEYRRPLADALGLTLAELDDLLNESAQSALTLLPEAWTASPTADPDTLEPGPSKTLARLVKASVNDSSGGQAKSWRPDLVSQVISEHLFGYRQTNANLKTAWADISTEPTLAIRAAIPALKDLGYRLGGGATHRLLLLYFQSDVIPILSQKHSDRVRRDVFGTSAELVEVLAWSAYDSGCHGAAQRFFAEGLKLAREVDHRPLAALLLAKLSHQANYLRRPREALQLARAAQSEAGPACPPAAGAMLLAMEARALATEGRSKECADALRMAECLLEQRDSADQPAWIAYFDEAEWMGEAAHCFRDLGQADKAIGFAEQALADASTPVRTRGFLTVVSAAATLQTGQIDRAVDLAIESSGLVGPLRSSRYLRYVEEFFEQLTARTTESQLVTPLLESVRQKYASHELPAKLQISPRTNATAEEPRQS